MKCKELVELVTEYLEGRLAPAERQAMDRHLADCDGCRAYLEQMRTTIATMGRISERELSVRQRQDLLRLFEGWKSA